MPTSYLCKLSTFSVVERSNDVVDVNVLAYVQLKSLFSSSHHVLKLKNRGHVTNGRQSQSDARGPAKQQKQGC